MMIRRALTLCLTLCFLLAIPALTQQERGNRPPEAAQPAKAAEKDGRDAKKEPPEPVVTHHEIHAAGKLLRYTATAGLMPIRNNDGEIEANIFFIAYTLDGASADRRPLTFSFNGGPGSASVWLHLGAIGPRRVKMQPDGMMPAPPYQLVDNDFTWLDQTDLVFIDPVGTGYSRAAKDELKKKFLGVREDIQSVGEFIRLYLGRHERWSSPLFLVGESYGTTRAAGLSGYLFEHGIAFNGILLISSALSFETLDFAPSNDLPYTLYLPTYASTAWYHKKLGQEFQNDFAKLRQEVEQWATTGYAEALAKGDRMTAEERIAAIDRLARYTGLSRSYIDLANLRIDEPHFTKELLRDRRQTVGRLDSRFTGSDDSGIAETARFDPSMTAIRPPYTAMFNQYVRSELGYKSDSEYFILGGGFGFNEWNWGSASAGFPDTAPSLKSAFDKNPFMRLFVGSGYFDLATPYFATQYTLNHLGLSAAQHSRVSFGFYPAGHMMYIQDESLGGLRRDIAAFMGGAVK
jgi:carboxypeptidase C (cathepsin A)